MPCNWIGDRSKFQTCALASRSRSAIRRPMPLEAPVTTAVLPVKSYLTVIFSPPMHDESRTDSQEHQRQNGYYALGLSLSETRQSNYETCVLHEPFSSVGR